MCQVINTLLVDSLDASFHGLELTSLSFLKTKLGRRLSKLEADRRSAAPKLKGTYNFLFSKLGPDFERTMGITSGKIETEWKQFKTSTRRITPQLRQFATDEQKILKLPNSSGHIQYVLDEASFDRDQVIPTGRQHATPDFEVSSVATQFIRKYLHLAKLESDYKEIVFSLNDDHELECIRLASLIEDYMKEVSKAYDGNPEQKSEMLLTIMELWVCMDKHCIQAIGLLSEYSPMFPTYICRFISFFEQLLQKQN